MCTASTIAYASSPPGMLYLKRATFAEGGDIANRNVLRLEWGLTRLALLHVDAHR